MSDFLGLRPIELFGIAFAFTAAMIWWLTRPHRVATGSRVQMTVFCLQCNGESRTPVGNPRCNRCGCRRVSVLTV